MALALGLALPPMLNLFWPLYDESKRVIEEEGDPFEQLINGALDSAKPVMLTLKGGKVYVGFVVSSFVPAREQRTIHIAPLRSGYREEKKQRVCFTTEYAEALDKIPQDIARLKDEKRQAEERLRQLQEVPPFKELLSRSSAARIEENKELVQAVQGSILTTRRVHEESVIQALTEEIEELETAINDFGIIIRIDEIISSTLYNARIHAEYFTHNEPEE